MFIVGMAIVTPTMKIATIPITETTAKIKVKNLRVLAGIVCLFTSNPITKGTRSNIKYQHFARGFDIMRTIPVITGSATSNSTNIFSYSGTSLAIRAVNKPTMMLAKHNAAPKQNSCVLVGWDLLEMDMGGYSPIAGYDDAHILSENVGKSRVEEYERQGNLRLWCCCQIHTARKSTRDVIFWREIPFGGGVWLFDDMAKYNRRNPISDDSEGNTPDPLWTKRQDSPFEGDSQSDCEFA